MKGILFAAALLVNVAYQKCGKPSARTAVPSCIQARIDSIKKEPRQNPPATVDEYLYNGRRVFLFGAPCCDRFNQVFDADCRYLCAPSGGFTGKGDKKCEDFKSSATFVRTVWKDER